jgi:hypothetical protein
MTEYRIELQSIERSVNNLGRDEMFTITFVVSGSEPRLNFTIPIGIFIGDVDEAHLVPKARQILHSALSTLSKQTESWAHQ